MPSPPTAILPPTTIRLPAPAKLNLFLHIVGRRPDGYHNLQTVFQLLDHGDELSFAIRDDGELVLAIEGQVSNEELSGSDNLILKAARLLQEGAHDTVMGATITLRKRLPLGGGLGGGSSDAATTLIALNRLWGMHISTDELAILGSKLGADVPVFVRGSSAWAEGIGEKLSPIDLPERWFLVIHPNCHISTKVIFSHPELTRDTPAITIPAFFAGPTQNDCENLVRRLAKPVDKALIWLQNFGEARMTGSGACVFSSFDNEASAQAILDQVPPEWNAFVAKGVNRSPVWEQLETMDAEAAP